MSAPSIPNLLSLRGGNRARGRGSRGRGDRTSGPERAPSTSPPSSSSSSSRQTGRDTPVQATDTDAAVSRLSAVELGYLDDPFARFFVPGTQPTRRLPIINRGTYTRTTALDRLVELFLSSDDGGDEAQVVSLGAGTDTRCFRLFSAAPPPRRRIIYHEIDFPAMTARKLTLVRATPRLREVLREPVVDGDGSSWHGDAVAAEGCSLWCHGLDLRELAADASVRPESSQASSSPPPPALPPAFDNGTTPLSEPERKQIRLPGLRTDIPTLLLSECCLCYLTPAEAAGVISWFTSRFLQQQKQQQQQQQQHQAPQTQPPQPSSPPFPSATTPTTPTTPTASNTTTKALNPKPSPGPGLGLILYEPIGPHTAFGRTMAANLAARNLHMPTLAVFPTARDQQRRLRDAGLDGIARAETVAALWARWVSAPDKAALDALEGGLDEVEEWDLLAGHYVVAWGSKGLGFCGWEAL